MRHAQSPTNACIPLDSQSVPGFVLSDVDASDVQCSALLLSWLILFTQVWLTPHLQVSRPLTLSVILEKLQITSGHTTPQPVSFLLRCACTDRWYSTGSNWSALFWLRAVNDICI